MSETVTFIHGTEEFVSAELSTSVVLDSQPVELTIDDGLTWWPALWVGDPGTTRTARTTIPRVLTTRAGETTTTYRLRARITDSGGEKPIIPAGFIRVTKAEVGAGPLTLEEAKAGLNMRGTADDAELARFLGAAVELAESIVGPIAERTITERHDDRGDRLVLRVTPVIGVESITARIGGAEVYGPTDLDVDPTSGIVRLAYDGRFDLVDSYYGGVNVTYRAGRAEVPEAIRTAIIVILDHLWKTQRGWVSRPSVRGEVPEAVESGVPLGFALPSRAEQLLEPYRVVVIA